MQQSTAVTERRSASDNSRHQILCKILIVSAFLLSVNAYPTYEPDPRHALHISSGILPRVKEAPAMPLAPLRLIVGRTMEVYVHHRGHPRQFAVHDVLECGHVYTSLLWDYLDLVNPYSDNPDVSARRHRCHACAVVARHDVHAVTSAVGA
jgi:hypothetical protein